MKRSDLLRTKEYWMADIQLKLFNQIENYRKQKKINRTQLAKELGVTKGYVTQVLRGDFDHKLSKMVELALACDSIPVVHFVKKDQFINDDSLELVYGLWPTNRPIDFNFGPQPERKTSNFPVHYATQNLITEPYAK